MNVRTPDRPVGHEADQARLPPLKGDGLPSLPTGEPVLHRWFVLFMLVLAPLAVAVTVWALLSIPGGELPPAERRPAGDGTVTIERGEVVLAESDESEPGPSCGEDVELVGDSGSRAAARRALGAACQLLRTGAFPEAEVGLAEWIEADGVLRMATFEFSGVESSTRLEGARIVVELNAKFLYEDATRGAPALLHQLVLIGDPVWPGDTVRARTELAAVQAQAEACGRLSFGGSPPRGCRDVEELLAEADPLAAIIAAGFPDSGTADE